MALYFALASVIYHVIIVVIHVCNISTSVDSRAYHKSKFYIFGYNIFYLLYQVSCCRVRNDLHFEGMTPTSNDIHHCSLTYIDGGVHIISFVSIALSSIVGNLSPKNLICG